MNSPEHTISIARLIRDHAMEAAANNPAAAREKVSETLADIIGFIATDAFDEPDGRELLADIVKHMSGARSSRDG